MMSKSSYVTLILRLSMDWTNNEIIIDHYSNGSSTGEESVPEEKFRKNYFDRTIYCKNFAHHTPLLKRIIDIFFFFFKRS